MQRQTGERGGGSDAVNFTDGAGSNRRKFIKQVLCNSGSKHHTFIVGLAERID